jgi:predicted amidohydrolase
MTVSPTLVRHISGDRPAAGEVRIACLQYGVTTDVAANLDKALAFIDLAAAEKPDVIMTPEFANHVSWYDTKEQAIERAITLDGPWIERIGAKAKEYGVWILLNAIVRRGEARVTGSNLLFTPDGELAAQSSKQVLMGSERLHFDPADVIGDMSTTPFGTTGMYSCMDGVIFETPRAIALRGARVMLNTLNSFAPDEASLHVPVRAAENKVWVISANKVDFLVNDGPRDMVSQALGVHEDTLRGAGESMVVAPDGTVIAQAPVRGDAILVVDFDPSSADDKRRPDGTDIFAARRPEIYAPIAAAPKGRTAGAGAERITSAVVQLAASGEAAITEAAAAVTKAAADGASLIVLPELFCFEGNVVATGVDAAARAQTAIDALTEALAGSDAVVVTSLPQGNAHEGVVISNAGVVHRQRQLHASNRHASWATTLGDAVAPYEAAWGRVAVLVGDDTIYPEAFRLAALADADVVACPVTIQEKWEVAVGFRERAAENRVNVVAASQSTSAGNSYVVPITAAFGMWRQDRTIPFDGRISDPDPVTIDPAPGTTLVEIFPAQAVNRMVTRDTDVVDGRPWQLVEPIVSA